MKEIALHLLDIAENSLDAGATRIEIKLELKPGGMLEMLIEDNGKGMDAEFLKKTKDPFFTSRNTRRVGMGIPLLRQHAEQTGGNLQVRSSKGKGTSLKAIFITGHPDIQPYGDIEGCWVLLAAMNNNVNIGLRCTTKRGDFKISSEQVKNELGIQELNDQALKSDLKRMIRNNLSAIGFEDKIIEYKT